MQLTKYTHACVRLEQDGRVLVIDPGIWAEPQALDGVTDILVTHEHFDHFDVDRFKDSGLNIYTNLDFAAQLAIPNAHAVLPGDEFTVAGFNIKAVGGKHAEIYDGLPGCANIGFIVDGNVYHPGDSLFVPDEPVGTALIPASGPWLKLREAIDFTRAIKPRQAFAIHEALLSDKGVGNFGNWMNLKGETQYQYLSPGTQLEV